MKRLDIYRAKDALGERKLAKINLERPIKDGIFYSRGGHPRPSKAYCL